MRVPYSLPCCQMLTKLIKTYAFDGIDIDWEYPAASDRDGVAVDTANYVTFLEELKEACGSSFLISATLPSSYWYMQGFDISGMEPYLDFFNLMSGSPHIQLLFDSLLILGSV